MITVTETSAKQNFASYVVQIITPPPVGGRGIVFGRFLCFFVSNITRKWLDRFA